MWKRRKNRDKTTQAMPSRAENQARDNANSIYANVAVKPPTVKEKLDARRIELIEQINKANDELMTINKQIEWIGRFPEVEAIIRSLAPGAFR